ncbi:DNA mismatch repair protein MutS [Alicyclobacillus sp. SP_1]|uniref:DNA mismatch repair protein MutS n=1 Tax=Alicyclobacillus sp. SP_1 TaxID=2942475 RepID=UPI0021586B0F|nr:DNA mismatch repair protein MutS [Alicyclobacillus sp. SP_1]
MTPMMKQYLEIKQQVPDALLMFRLGDFYELFFEDAETASRVLDITLTGRDGGEDGRIPMCGVPYHAVEGYLDRLIGHGYKVAICNQMEDPKQSKGIVRREIVRMVTPGTSLTDEGLERRSLGALVESRGEYGLAIVDLLAGDVWMGSSFAAEEIRDWLLLHGPAEILFGSENLLDELHVWYPANAPMFTACPGAFDGSTVHSLMLRCFLKEEWEALGLTSDAVAVQALYAVLDYAQTTQRQSIVHCKRPIFLTTPDALQMDATAIRHLELFETNRTRMKEGTLFHHLNRTQTVLGSRMLKSWLERPLGHLPTILQRQEAVEVLLLDGVRRAEIKQLLRQVADVERLLGRVVFQRATPKDLYRLGTSLAAAMAIRSFQFPKVSRVTDLQQGMPDVLPIVDLTVVRMHDNPPTSARDGGIWLQGVSSRLDELRLLASEGKQWIAAFEQRERDRTGIRTLKVGYNKVFGYFVEVSKGQSSLVPSDYERRQTLASAERYTLPELKLRESAILSAAEDANALEENMFNELCEQILAERHKIQACASCLAEIDALVALAEVAEAYGYERPEVHLGRGIDIKAGRHPVVEAGLAVSFVPNDCHLDEDNNFVVLTGPNMGGKSTYMRQIALIAIMAHIGSFVPARAARIGILDRIFTRIGAADDIHSGQSTFMVEMSEVSHILKHATSRSLVILDEMGRGTSTYDGLAIAEAVVEYLQSESRPFCLFATHYHELIALAQDVAGVRNASLAVAERGSSIEFLHVVVSEPADRSYGLHVARLAGISERVLERASLHLARREAQAKTEAEVSATHGIAPLAPPPSQSERHSNGPMETLALRRELDGAANLLRDIAAVDPLTTTPIDALIVLQTLVSRAKEVVERWVSFN